MKKRVTYHNTKPGPITEALVEQYAGTEVPVQQQRFIRKTSIAKIVQSEGEEDEWVFLDEELQRALLRLKPRLEEEYERRNPQFSLLMLDSEPVLGLFGPERIAILQKVLAMCDTLLGQNVQVGFYAIPPHRGLFKSRPPVRLLDTILAMQGSIFLQCGFWSKGQNWFAHGMAKTRKLIDRVAPLRDGRPVVAYCWPRRWQRAGFALIPDDLLIEHLTLLNDNDIEISVASFGRDQEGAYLIELARLVVMGLATVDLDENGNGEDDVEDALGTEDGDE